MNSKVTKLRFFATIFSITLLLSCTRQQNEPFHNSTIQQNTNTIHSIPVHVTMVYIPGGEYKPFYGSEAALVKVEPFLLDERAVTNREYLAFVLANPTWQKSNVKRVFADTAYLQNWQTDVSLPEGLHPDAPVCNVSWFAAKAYATSVGKRLPTLDEWEFVAMADADTLNARSKPEYSDNIISLYMQKNRQFNPVKQNPPNYWGVYNMFDLIWEWTDDFNSVLVTSDSRSGQYEDNNLFCAGGATSATDILNYAAFMRFALRTTLKANYAIPNLGFRCARDTLFLSN